MCILCFSSKHHIFCSKRRPSQKQLKRTAGCVVLSTNRYICNTSLIADQGILRKRGWKDFKSHRDICSEIDRLLSGMLHQWGYLSWDSVFSGVLDLWSATILLPKQVMIPIDVLTRMWEISSGHTLWWRWGKLILLWIWTHREVV